ncbi:NUDIX hydrolase [Thermomonospora umbrina]|uniref:ADP-ribose pyrophosphatase YjhB (NUDIX family) n=1 Tax=Thermomonospora umbrina TaxID=111806 RepID=A0A3D9SVT4_9ACTN|nr:CoA pyrophosphatase [Thermomonospora umbrina]REF00063.1 ADP-ribose pyrophosphatase YjhB (NUDIX family) [Thermomonospora umbrina]
MTPPHDTVAAFAALARERLAARSPVLLDGGPGVRRAAVVLCVVEHGGAPSVIVIKRALRGRNAGQWALPGGRLDDGETVVRAALRELHEEIGLTADPVDVLGRLDDFPAASGFVISSLVLALEDPGPPRPSPDEVHSVHPVTLERLAADDAVRWVPQVDGGRLLQMTLGPAMTVHAPTGALLWQFREVVLHGRDVRVADLLQPDWTRR